MSASSHRDRRRQTPEQLRARADRILDAASELLARYGFDKTTLDDVARRAHVAKGTLYLHWKSKQELFATLLRRERHDLLHSVRQRAAEHAESLGGLMRLFAEEIAARPLLKAIMLEDREIVGDMMRVKRDHPGTANAALAAAGAYIDVLIGLGLVRADLDRDDVNAVVLAALYGYFFTPELDGLPPLGRRAELLAETIHRTVEARPLLPADVAKVAQATTDYLDRAVEIARTKLEESYVHAPVE